MKKFSISVIAFFTLSIMSFGQSKITFIEEGGKNNDGISIPYKKYQLENGLTIVVHEDHSDPIVYVDVTYHVGSARELPGRSGFAHFFEHMMFQGSDNVADEEHFKIVTESGGRLNGTTNSDRTNYFETLPSNQLETALWLESDRMGFFLDAVTQQKFEIQRATVKNERGQNYDNRPYGLIYEKTKEALYPFGHPYSWTTIGYIEDLNAATLDDLKNFFLRWYGPNNATLTISGDVSTEEAVKLAEKYFGSIPRGPEVKKMAPQPVQLSYNKYMSYEDNVKMPYLKWVFPTVESAHPDAIALDVLAEILGSGKNSMMYQTFVKTQLSNSAFAYHPTAELHGTLEFHTYNKPGTKLADIENILREKLNSFLDKPISADDVERIKTKMITSTISRLQSVQGKGAQLAYFQTFYGTPDAFHKEIEAIKAVTPKHVEEVFKKYVLGKNYVCISVVPKGQSNLLPQPDNTTRWTIPADFKADISEYQNLTYNKAKDNFDRSKKPTPGPSPAVPVPNFKAKNFSNGMKGIFTPYDELPVSSITLYLPFGQITETKEKAGITQILASMMNEGTEKFSAEQFEVELEKIGANVRVMAGKEEFVIQLSALNDNLDKAIELLKERMFHSVFTQENLDRIKNQTIQGINNQQTQATTIANNVLNQILFGDHINAINIAGTVESVSSITLEDVKNYYNTYFAPDNGYFVSVGKITDKDIKKRLAFINNWAKKGLSTANPVAAQGVDQTTIFFVDKEGAAQSEIRVAFPSIYYDADGLYYKLGLMNFPLGGAFNSRINLNLREEHGWTYGARSRFSSTELENKFIASAGVKKEATDSSIIEIVKEITQYALNGPTADEITFTKNSIGQSEALDYETPGQKAGFLKMILKNNADKNLQKRRTQILNNITVDEIAKLANEYLPYNKLIIVIVGDKATVWDGIQKLGYPIIELDTHGNKIK